MFPDFLGIGAQKAGTTWLHENLATQPGVWLPPIKEIHFLDHAPPSLVKRLWGRTSHHRIARAQAYGSIGGLFRREPELSRARRAFRIAFAHRNMDWYASIFPEERGVACGEICPGYARLDRETIAEIYRRNSQLKVIYLLRDPVDRAWSSLAMHFRKGNSQLIGDVSESEVLERLAQPKTFSHCQYAQNIANWESVVPTAQIFYGFFEQISESATAHLERILRFLGIEYPVAATNADARVNAGRGEAIPPSIEIHLARLLLPEAVALHQRFHNAYTARWLAHAQSVAAKA
jgi:hypothetical protein